MPLNCFPYVSATEALLCTSAAVFAALVTRLYASAALFAPEITFVNPDDILDERTELSARAASLSSLIAELAFFNSPSPLTSACALIVVV